MRSRLDFGAGKDRQLEKGKRVICEKYFLVFRHYIRQTCQQAEPVTSLQLLILQIGLPVTTCRTKRGKVQIQAYFGCGLSISQ